MPLRFLLRLILVSVVGIVVSYLECRFSWFTWPHGRAPRRVKYPGGKPWR